MQENSSFISENASGKAIGGAPKEKAHSFNMALGALFLVAIVTAVFHVLAFMTNKTVEENANTVSVMKQEIANLKSDKKNSVASLIEKNAVLDSIALIDRITALSNLSTKYQVSFQNFSVKDNVISTNLVARGTEKDAVEKIIAMMNEFAKTPEQGNFTLEPIFSISGDATTRTTPISFKIVPKKEAAQTTVSEPITPVSENSSN